MEGIWPKKIWGNLHRLDERTLSMNCASQFFFFWNFGGEEEWSSLIDELGFSGNGNRTRIPYSWSRAGLEHHEEAVSCWTDGDSLQVDGQMTEKGVLRDFWREFKEWERKQRSDSKISWPTQRKVRNNRSVAPSMRKQAFDVGNDWIRILVSISSAQRRTFISACLVRLLFWFPLPPWASRSIASFYLFLLQSKISTAMFAQWWSRCQLSIRLIQLPSHRHPEVVRLSSSRAWFTRPDPSKCLFSSNSTKKT